MKRFSLGLKLWSTDRALAEEAGRLVSEGAYDYIELFSVPSSFDDCVGAWRNLRVPFVVHAPHSMKGLNPSRPDMERGNRLLAAEAHRYADALDASHVIFHPGIGGSLDEAIRQLLIWKDDRCLVENKPRIGIDGSECVGWSTSQISAILAETRYGFCLDLGHAQCAAAAAEADPKTVIGDFMDLGPCMFHMTDGKRGSLTDRHDRYGYGSFDLGAWIGAIPALSRITNECQRANAASLDEAREDSSFLAAACALQSELPGIEIKRARVDDVDAVFALSNDPAVRAASFVTEPIQYDNHVRWLEEKIRDSNCLFLVFYDGAEFIGQIRFQKEAEGDFEVSISVSAESRGRGFAKPMMRSALACIRGKAGAAEITARVKLENLASLKFFQSMGFVEISEQVTGSSRHKTFKYYLFQQPGGRAVGGDHGA